jgi:MFS family permease
MLLKKLRPNRLIAALIIGFSASILSAGFIKNVAGLYITRLLLGVFESGLFPYDIPRPFWVIINILQLPHCAFDNFL